MRVVGLLSFYAFCLCQAFLPVPCFAAEARKRKAVSVFDRVHVKYASTHPHTRTVQYVRNVRKFAKMMLLVVVWRKRVRTLRTYVCVVTCTVLYTC